MKKLIGLLALAFVLMPAIAFAQAQPAPSPWPSGGPPHHSNFGATRQMHEQMSQLYRTTRAKMLDALTPQHRQLLANVVGQLAISPNPDRRAAAAQLDAALSPSEKQNILSIHQGAIDQMQAMVQQSFPNAPQHPFGDRTRGHTPSAGELLLSVASNEMHPIQYRPMGPRMPSPAAS